MDFSSPYKIITLYKALVRSKLEFASTDSCPMTIQDEKLIEKVILLQGTQKSTSRN